MGIGVSNWRLAKSVSIRGQLGVVSGTALASVLVRRLQDGDVDGNMRRALAALPLSGVADRIIAEYFLPDGRAAGTPYKLSPLFTLHPSRELVELTVAANFCEIYLAKEGHAGVVGLNLLEKIQMPTLASLFGAMLAGVDYVLMGAGIPQAIPGVLDRFSNWEAATLRIAVDGEDPAEKSYLTLTPSEYLPVRPASVVRPRFLAIVSSSTLALSLARKASGRVDGFVVEGRAAGGHNAPPRGSYTQSPMGEPIYGPRDVPDIAAIRALGMPFWLAGSCATAERLRDAQAQGAVGVQIGTAFAFCEESGLSREVREATLAACVRGDVRLLTDPRISPTGMPFKVLRSVTKGSESEVAAGRNRVCDLGYLRQAYRKLTGGIGYRCAAEPEEDFVKKGGNAAETVGRQCLCNGLLAGVGLGQLRSGSVERAIVTAGEDVAHLARYLKDGCTTYFAADVLAGILEIDSASATG